MTTQFRCLDTGTPLTVARRILNAKNVDNRPATDRIYVGRPTNWGNPFVIGRDGTRDEVIP